MIYLCGFVGVVDMEVDVPKYADKQSKLFMNHIPSKEIDRND